MQFKFLVTWNNTLTRANESYDLGKLLSCMRYALSWSRLFLSLAVIIIYLKLRDVCNHLLKSNTSILYLYF